MRWASWMLLRSWLVANGPGAEGPRLRREPNAPDPGEEYLGCKKGCGLILNFDFFFEFSNFHRTLNFRTSSVPNSQNAAVFRKF